MSNPCKSGNVKLLPKEIKYALHVGVVCTSCGGLSCQVEDHE